MNTTIPIEIPGLPSGGLVRHSGILAPSDPIPVCKDAWRAEDIRALIEGAAR